MLRQAELGWRILRRLASAGLLALLLGIQAAPLALALSPRDCGCHCPRDSHSCCCRRKAHDAEATVLQWTSVACCNGHCPRAAAGPLTFAAFPVPLVRAGVAATTSSCPLPTSALNSVGHSFNLDLAFLYQRPPPLA